MCQEALGYGPRQVLSTQPQNQPTGPGQLSATATCCSLAIASLARVAPRRGSRQQKHPREPGPAPREARAAARIGWLSQEQLRLQQEEMRPKFGRDKNSTVSDSLRAFAPKLPPRELAPCSASSPHPTQTQPAPHLIPHPHPSFTRRSPRASPPLPPTRPPIRPPFSHPPLSPPPPLPPGGHRRLRDGRRRHAGAGSHGTHHQQQASSQPSPPHPKPTPRGTHHEQ
jgi:hypothetical protein